MKQFITHYSKTRVELSDAEGKYTAIREGIHWKVLRHGEPWQDFTGAKFVSGILNALVEQLLPITEKEANKLREDTFSTDNPFCPCDSKTFQKVVNAIEYHKTTQDRETDYEGACAPLPPGSRNNRAFWRLRPLPPTE